MSCQPSTPKANDAAFRCTHQGADAPRSPDQTPNTKHETPNTNTTMQPRDRIQELRRVKASTLRPNPRNWRTHPAAQQDALRGILAEVGYANALLVRPLEDGSLELIDGHLRAETTPDMEVPVLVLDVTAEEAAKLLAVHDPLADMAVADPAKLGDL